MQWLRYHFSAYISPLTKLFQQINEGFYCELLQTNLLSGDYGGKLIYQKNRKHDHCFRSLTRIKRNESPLASQLCKIRNRQILVESGQNTRRSRIRQIYFLELRMLYMDSSYWQCSVWINNIDHGEHTTAHVTHPARQAISFGSPNLFNTLISIEK